MGASVACVNECSLVTNLGYSTINKYYYRIINKRLTMCFKRGPLKCVFNKFHEMHVSSVLMFWCVYCRILQGQGHDWQQQGCVLSGGVGREDSVLVKCSRSFLLIATFLTRPHDKLLYIFSDCSVTHSPANLTDQRSMQTKFHLSSAKQTFLLYSQPRHCRFFTDSNHSIYTKTNLSIFRTT